MEQQQIDGNSENTLKSLFQHPIVVNFPLFSSLFVLRRIDPRLEIWNRMKI